MPHVAQATNKSHGSSHIYIYIYIRLYLRTRASNSGYFAKKRVVGGSKR